MTDERSIEALRRGDREALDALVTRLYPDVYRFLRHLTRHRQEAEDLAQQTFLRALSRLESYEGRASLRSWILAVAYREFLRWRRRRLWLPLVADRPALDDPFGELAEAEALLTAIGRLPEGLRVTFLLFHVEEVPVAEIALALDVPEGTVKSRLHAARTRLRQILGDEEAFVPEAC